MKRSNNKQKEMTAALYVRLSRDDNLEGDRQPKEITNQNCKGKRLYKFIDILRRRYFGRYNGTSRI